MSKEMLHICLRDVNKKKKPQLNDKTNPQQKLHPNIRRIIVFLLFVSSSQYV